MVLWLGVFASRLGDRGNTLCFSLLNNTSDLNLVVRENVGQALALGPFNVFVGGSLPTGWEIEEILSAFPC